MKIETRSYLVNRKITGARFYVITAAFWPITAICVWLMPQTAEEFVPFAL